MILLLCFLSIRSFRFLNIFDWFSPVVSLLTLAIFDLKEFLSIYFFFLVNFSLMMTTIQNASSIDYQYVGSFAGNFIDTMQISLGEYEKVVERFKDVDSPHWASFWVIWGLIVLIMSIIFLNFIIAEASASYERVNKRLQEVIQRNKVGLINEAERMLPKHLRNNNNYPKYIIKR